MNQKRPGDSKGFSIIELLFAIAVVATSLLLFVGIFFTMFKATQKGVDLTAGTIVAESQLSKFLYNMQENSPNGLDDLNKNGEIESSTYGGQGSVSVNRCVYSYEIKSWQVSSDPDFSNLRKVLIKTWWWGDTSDSSEAKQKKGYGKLSVSISRLVYTKNKVSLSN